jgi:nicotinamidase-related amidase
MTDPLTISSDKTALLIMDYQIGIVARTPNGSETALRQAGAVLSAARHAGIPVIYVQVGFRRGYPEVSKRNQNFSVMSQTGRFVIPDDPDAAIHPAVAPTPDDVIVVKKRISAFAGSDLEMILRALEIETLIIFGISTSGVVLSTVRQAADMDYRMIVVKDCCLDRDDEVHRVLTEKIFPPYATVLTSTEILPALRPRG